MKPKHLKSTQCRHKGHAHSHHDHSHHHHHHRHHPLEFRIESSTDEEEDDDGLLSSNDFDGSCSGLTWDSLMNLQNEEDGIIEISMGEETEEDGPLLESDRKKREQLIERLRIYNNLLKFHKTIKEDQVFLYKKLQDMDELYLRNTAVILRLGFCPCLVHQQTSPIGDKLMKIHRNLRDWDKKLEDISDNMKDSSTSKSATAVLQVMNICEVKKLGKAQGEFNDVALPEIVWNLNNTYIKSVKLSDLTEEWSHLRLEVGSQLFNIDSKFREICLEFGVRRGPAAAPSSSGRKSIRVSVSNEDNENGTEENDIYPNEQEADGQEEEEEEDTSNVSSSFL